MPGLRIRRRLPVPFPVLQVLCWLLVVGCLPAVLRSQEPQVRFQHLTVEDGLPDSNVYGVLQDRLGFLWLATSTGLVRYDGYTFTTYKPDPDDPGSLSGRLVVSLYEDRAGELWIGTRGGGLNRLDREKDRFVHYRHDPQDPRSLDHDSVSAILGDRHGGLWIGTGDLEMYTPAGGLNRFDRDTGTFLRFQHDPDDPGSLSFGAVIALWEDRHGELWIGTAGGGLDRFDAASGTFVHYRHDPDDAGSLSDDVVTALREDRAGRLWVGTWAGGLDRLDRRTGTFKHYRHVPEDPGSLAMDRVLSLHEDQDGTLWIGTRGVLDRYDPAGDSFRHFRHDPLDPNSLSNNIAIWGMAEDRAGMLWIATRGSGLDKLDRYGSQFFRYTHKPRDPDSLSHERVAAVSEDQAGDLWVGTLGGGLDRIDAETGTFTHYRPQPGRPGSLASDVVTALHQSPSGALWVGTGNGLDRFDPATETFTHFAHDPGDPTSLASNRVSKVLEDRAGKLWVSTLGGGLDRLEAATGTFTHYRRRPEEAGSLPTDVVLALYEDRAGTLWVGLESAGFCRFEPATETFVCYHSPAAGLEAVTALYEDRAGRFWLGTFNGGLHLFDRAATGPGTTRSFTDRHGLPHDTVYSILEGDDGRLWLSTGKGLSVFDPSTETFKSYDHTDGIRGDWFFGGAWRSSRGKLYFGGSGGLYAFFPGDIHDNPHPPQVVLTDFLIAGRPVPIGDAGPLRQHISVAEEIRLRHDENMISISFAALHYSDPASNRHAFRLDPLDAEWNQVGSQRWATYTHLAPGEYTFRVKAANSDGIWSSESAAVRLVVSPPWWRTWWAYGLYVALLAAAAFGAERAQRAQVVRRERQKAERARAHLTAEAARLQAQAAEAQARALQAEYERQNQELEEARQLQLSMLPKEIPRHPTLEIAAAMTTATEVGGDYYDWDLAADGTLTVVVGDATGHGSRAGTMVTAAKSLFNYLCAEPDVARVLEQSTVAIQRMTLRRLFMAMVIAKVEANRLQLANAGMPPVLFYRAAARRVEEIQVAGVPLGSFVGFPYQKVAVDLSPGDTMVMMSDGLPELRNPDGEMYGYARLQATFLQVAEQPPEEIIRHFTRIAEEWADGRPQDDDMTFVVLKVKEMG